MYNKDANGEKIYFYGSREGGYSYFVLDDNGELKIYNYGSKTGKVINGLDVYEFMYEGAMRYYTADMENGYTYYVKDTTYYGTKDSAHYQVATATERTGEVFAELDDGTVIYKENGTGVYYSVDENGAYTLYDYFMSVRDYCDRVFAQVEDAKTASAEMAAAGGDAEFAASVQARIDRNNMSREDDVEEEEVEEYSRYATENIVAVTYGELNGSEYKTILLNYNNYTVRVVYDNIEYTIPPYEFVVIGR